MFVKIKTRDHGVVEVNKNLVCSIRPYHHYGLKDEFDRVIVLVNGDTYKIDLSSYYRIVEDADR